MADKQNTQYDRTMLRVGSTLQNGKYRIDRYLASGGFGNTYLGTDLSWDEDIKVAIKEFFMKDVNQRVGDSTAVSISNVTQMPIFQEQMTKFKKEAQRLHDLKNPHIVSVSDLFDENGTTYYVMEYIDGLSLRDMVKQRGKLVEQEVLGYLNQTLDALEEVHRQKIFHLDIKPANLMVDKNGHVWLIDFGASKQQKMEGGATSRSAVCYSPGYAPIEQKDQEFKNFGPWTDLYALGATLYNALTGLTPPSTNTILDEGDSAFKFPTSISEKMRNLVFWMMKGPRSARPQSVKDVRQYLSSSTIPNSGTTTDDDETILAGDDGVSIVANEELSDTDDKSRKRKKKKILLATTVVISIIILAGLFSLYNGNNQNLYNNYDEYADTLNSEREAYSYISQMSQYLKDKNSIGFNENLKLVNQCIERALQNDPKEAVEIAVAARNFINDNTSEIKTNLGYSSETLQETEKLTKGTIQEYIQGRAKEIGATLPDNVFDEKEYKSDKRIW